MAHASTALLVGATSPCHLAAQSATNHRALAQPRLSKSSMACSPMSPMAFQLLAAGMARATRQTSNASVLQGGLVLDARRLFAQTTATTVAFAPIKVLACPIAHNAWTTGWAQPANCHATTATNSPWTVVSARAMAATMVPTVA